MNKCREENILEEQEITQIEFEDDEFGFDNNEKIEEKKEKEVVEEFEKINKFNKNKILSIKQY